MAATWTNRSGCQTGRFRRTRASRMLKIAVFAPMPNASVSTVTAANPGLCLISRIQPRKSCGSDGIVWNCESGSYRITVLLGVVDGGAVDNRGLNFFDIGHFDRKLL